MTHFKCKDSLWLSSLKKSKDKVMYTQFKLQPVTDEQVEIHPMGAVVETLPPRIPQLTEGSGWRTLSQNKACNQSATGLFHWPLSEYNANTRGFYNQRL